MYMCFCCEKIGRDGYWLVVDGQDPIYYCAECAALLSDGDAEHLLPADTVADPIN